MKETTGFSPPCFGGWLDWVGEKLTNMVDVKALPFGAPPAAFLKTVDVVTVVIVVLE